VDEGQHRGAGVLPAHRAMADHCAYGRRDGAIADRTAKATALEYGSIAHMRSRDLTSKFYGGHPAGAVMRPAARAA
jgi:hypothetical protein